MALYVGAAHEAIGRLDWAKIHRWGPTSAQHTTNTPTLPVGLVCHCVYTTGPMRSHCGRDLPSVTEAVNEASVIYPLVQMQCVCVSN